MSSVFNFNNSNLDGFNGIAERKKKDFDSMIEAILMVALQNKIDVKKMNHEEIINFVKKEKSNIEKELKTIEQNKKNSKNQKQENNLYNKHF